MSTGLGTAVPAVLSALGAAAATLVSGLLAVFVAPALAVTGTALAVREGRTRSIGVGLAGGALLTLAVLLLVRRAAGD